MHDVFISFMQKKLCFINNVTPPLCTIDRCTIVMDVVNLQLKTY